MIDDADVAARTFARPCAKHKETCGQCNPTFARHEGIEQPVDEHSRKRSPCTGSGPQSTYAEKRGNPVRRMRKNKVSGDAHTIGGRIRSVFFKHVVLRRMNLRAAAQQPPGRLRYSGSSALK